MHCQITDHRLLIHHGGIPFRQGFQRLDEPLLVSFVHIGFGVVEDVGVAGRVVIGVLQEHIGAAHATAAATVAPVARAAEAFAGHGHAFRETGLAIWRYHWEDCAFVGHTASVALAASLCFLLHPLPELLHIKAFAVASARAEGHAVRFVQLAGVIAEIPA